MKFTNKELWAIYISLVEYSANLRMFDKVNRTVENLIKRVEKELLK